MNDQAYMELAIQLAKSTKGQTSPNPVVGAVIVNNGEVVGMGAHLKAGYEHAEVHAIKMAGEKAFRSTVYVTLEPCSHFGKTPPCADLLIESGVKRVVIASTDPNPMVAGKGIEKLREAGIETEVGLLQDIAMDLNKVFFHFVSTKRPFVTLKTATSLDGKIATSIGESKWITGEIAREDVHQLRHEHDAILVGIGTVLADDPSLTTRKNEGGKHPIRIILDHQLKIPLEAKVVKDKIAPTWLITSSEASPNKQRELEDRGVKVIRFSNAKIEIEQLVTVLGEEGITSLLVEGGSRVNDSFIRSGYINEVITYIAPKLIGGEDAPGSFGGQGFVKLADALLLNIKAVQQLGNDIKITAVPREGN